MLDPIVLPLIAQYLTSNGYTASMLPEEKADPVSGTTYLRVSGTSNQFEMRDTSFSVRVGFSIYFSRRTRDAPIQTRDDHYAALLKTAGKVFREIIGNSGIQSHLTDNFDFSGNNIGLHGRFMPESQRTDVEELYPTFYGSYDGSSERIAGYGIQHIYSTPWFSVPLECLDIDSALNTAIDAVTYPPS